jgi:Caspase domain
VLADVAHRRDDRPVARRALLIGSETSGLTGCNRDVELMRDTLAARDFADIETRIDGDANRAGIVDGFERLIGSVAADDAIVVYYSGHGGRVVRPDFDERKAAGLAVHFQFLVPTDMDDSDVGDFRGVLSEELTGYQRRLTDAFITLGSLPNVTTILDCCHSGYMARAVDVVQKSIDAESKSFRMRGIREHAAQLSGVASIAGLATNREAVRIVACQSEESAFEFPSARGGRHGAMTDALVSVLDDLGPAPVSWGMAAELVRRRVRALVPEQRPDVEGPSDRLLFSGDRLAQHNALALTVMDDVVTIEAAALLGVAVGDQFRLVKAGFDKTIGTAVVERISSGSAILDITSTAADPGEEISDGNAVAIPTSVTVPRVLVAVEFDGESADRLRQRLGDEATVAVTTESTKAAIRVIRQADKLILCDESGDRWRVDAYGGDDAGSRALVQDIDAIAIGHRLLDLPLGEGESALGPVMTVEFGAVVDGERRPLASSGERLGAGSKVFLTVTNTSAETLYVWIFDVGVSGRSALVTNAAPSGTLLGAAGTEEDRLDVWGSDGESLFWPEDVPVAGVADGGRWESMIVLTADRRGDLSSLASSSGARVARGSARSPLDALILEARTGVREVSAAGPNESPLRYRMDTVRFLLQPT